MARGRGAQDEEAGAQQDARVGRGTAMASTNILAPCTALWLGSWIDFISVLTTPVTAGPRQSSERLKPSSLPVISA